MNFGLDELAEILRRHRSRAELAGMTPAAASELLSERTTVAISVKMAAAALKQAQGSKPIRPPFDSSKFAEQVYVMFADFDTKGTAQDFPEPTFRLRGWQSGAVIPLTDGKIQELARRLADVEISRNTAADVRRATWGHWLTGLAAAGTTNAPRDEDPEGDVSSANDRGGLAQPTSENVTSEDEFTRIARRKAMASGRHPAGGGRR